MIDGSKRVVDDILDNTHGAGNVSISILVCTGLELASKLYAGKEVNATDSVKNFIKKYFPDNSAAQNIPLILWNGIRNGTNHIFIPNIIETSTNTIEFSFFVDHNPNMHSIVTKSNNRLQVYVNSIEFYRMFKAGIEKYKADLEIDETLQCHFIDMWREIEKPHDSTVNTSVSKEVKYLLRRLQNMDSIDLF